MLLLVKKVVVKVVAVVVAVSSGQCIRGLGIVALATPFVTVHHTFLTRLTFSSIGESYKDFFTVSESPT